MDALTFMQIQSRLVHYESIVHASRRYGERVSVLAWLRKHIKPRTSKRIDFPASYAVREKMDGRTRGAA